MSALEVDGYSTENPVLDSEWEDAVRWEINYPWTYDADNHDLNGFFADYAGGPACKALGHTLGDADSWEEVSGHETGWDDEYLCLATQHGPACVDCESDDCPILNRATDTRKFWKLFTQTGEGEGQ